MLSDPTFGYQGNKMAEQDFEEMIMDIEETSAIEDVAADDYRDPLTLSSLAKQQLQLMQVRQLDENVGFQLGRVYRGLYGPGYSLLLQKISCVCKGN